jgi:hypothetical protein
MDKNLLKDFQGKHICVAIKSGRISNGVLKTVGEDYILIIPPNNPAYKNSVTKCVVAISEIASILEYKEEEDLRGNNYGQGTVKVK